VRRVGVSPRSGFSLDERYLDFCTKTGAAFALHPQLEPLRPLVFKDLLVRRRADGWWPRVKHWMRPLHRRASTPTPQRADVLIWIEGQREVIVDALFPVYRELLRRGVSVALVSDGGSPPGPVAAHATPFQYPARAIAPMWASGAWEALCACEPGLRDRALGRAFLRATAMLQGRIDEQRRLFEAIRPQAVVAASTQLPGGAGLAVTARAQGGRSLLLQHGILQPFYAPLLTDLMLTWGPSSDEIMMTLGVPPERLVATGSPRHDTMKPSGDGRARERLLRALRLPDRPTFVFFSNGNDVVRNGTAPAECADWLETAAARYASELNVVVRLHPNEDGALYRRCPHLTLTRAAQTLGDTLDGCDWLGSLCSTVLYDGLLYGKPVWQFHADGWPALADNWSQALARRVRSAAQLSELVGTMLDGGGGHGVDKSAVARVFANHGQATQAVAEIVTRQLSPRGPNPRPAVAELTV
jgi:hypothetical protein